MKEIELGKSLAENPHINVVKFIGCVTTQSKNPHSSFFSTRYLVFFFFFLFVYHTIATMEYSLIWVVSLQFTQ